MLKTLGGENQIDLRNKSAQQQQSHPQRVLDEIDGGSWFARVAPQDVPQYAAIKPHYWLQIRLYSQRNNNKQDVTSSGAEIQRVVVWLPTTRTDSVHPLLAGSMWIGIRYW